ncbi:hypothetical protein ZWY2020_029025 [Hordeum vulgare]|nr:hypothetical protein ZWY2020_029025 [Hordeum vulgare]
MACCRSTFSASLERRARKQAGVQNLWWKKMGAFSPSSSAAPTAAGAQIPPTSPNCRSLVGPASLLHLLASSPASLSSASPPPLRVDAAAARSTAPDGSSGKIHYRILTVADVSSLFQLPAALPPAAPRDPPRPRLSSLLVAPEGWTAQSTGAPPRPRLQSIVVAPCGDPATGSPPPAPSQAFNAMEAPADPALEWNLVRSRKETRAMKAASFGDPHLQQRRGPPSHPVALQQHLAFKARFNGRCFRCLSMRHQLASCRDPIRCIRCKRTGHLARSCSSRLSSQPPPTGRKQQHPTQPPQVNPAAWPALPVGSSEMELTPGIASCRPMRSSCIVLSTPEMEADAYHLRRTTLTATTPDARVDLNTALVAKALEQVLDIPRESIQVASAHPEDYLIRFSEPYQRDLALERGYVRVEGIRLQLEQWEPAPAGTIRSLRFYCRLAISGIKFHAWRLDVVKKLLGGSCIVDRMERQTERLQNVTAFFVWVWTENPDLIPKVADLTIVDRVGDGRNRHQLPDGVPAEECRQGPMTGVLIHLVLAKDYSLVASNSSSTAEYPRIFTYNVQIGTMDGRVVPPKRPLDAGPSRLPRRCDYDVDDEGKGRQRRRRAGKHRSLWQSVVGGDAATSPFDPKTRLWWSASWRLRRATNRHRAPSRSSDREGRWCTSKSPPPTATRQAASASSSTAIPAGYVHRASSSRSRQGAAAAPTAAVIVGRSSSRQSPSTADNTARSTAADNLPYTRWGVQAGKQKMELQAAGDAWNGTQAAMAALYPLDEIVAAASNHNVQHIFLTTRPTTEDDGLHGSMLNSFGEMGISYPATNQLMHQPSGEPSVAAMPGQPSTQLPTAADHAGNDWVTNRSIPEAISWDHLVAADSAQRTFFNNCGINAHSLNTWDAFVARTPAIDFTGMQGPPPHIHSEICFGPGVQISQSGSAREQMDNVAPGREIVTAIISRVASLLVEKQRWFIGRVADLLSPSLLGAPMLPDSEPGKIKKKLFASMTKLSKKTKAHATSHSFMAARKSQARFCVRLGLINDISEFNKDTLKMYLSFFKHPMPESLLSKLTEVAGISAPPCINLPDTDLQLILDELNAETN